MNLKHPSTLIATWFGAGLLPKAPGTWGALAALPFAVAFKYWSSTEAFIFVTITVFLIGVWACEAYIQHLQQDDPSSAVIDEVAAQWMVLWFLPLNLWDYILAFLLFRGFDIMKPWPVSWLDRHVKGGFGTMIDDVVAAIYALLVLIALAFALKWMGIDFAIFR